MKCTKCDRPVLTKRSGLCSPHYHQARKRAKNPNVKQYANMTDAERFWQYVEKTETCWLWKGGISKTGYGVFAMGSRRNGSFRSVLPHRFSFEVAGHALTEGRQIDHLCRNRCCVNPAHLEQVTARENTLRSTAPSALNAQKTHCHRGHAFDQFNTYIAKNGARHCRACHRFRKARAKLDLIEAGLGR